MKDEAGENVRKAAERGFHGLPGLPPGVDLNRAVTALYTNWNGETAARRVIPLRLYFGSTQHHQTPQWLI